MTTDTRRQTILDAALAAFTAQGYEATTIADICRRACVSNGAVFHHFKSKEAIAAAIHLAALADFQAGLAVVLDRCSEKLEEAIRAAVSHHLAWNEGHRDLAQFMYGLGRPGWTMARGEAVADLNNDMATRLRAWLEPHVAAGALRPLSITALVACVVGPAHFVAQRWLSGQTERPPSAFAAELGDAAVAALMVGGGGPAGQGAAPLPTARDIVARHLASATVTVDIRLAGVEGVFATTTVQAPLATRVPSASGEEDDE